MAELVRLLPGPDARLFPGTPLRWGVLVAVRDAGIRDRLRRGCTEAQLAQHFGWSRSTASARLRRQAGRPEAQEARP